MQRRKFLGLSSAMMAMMATQNLFGATKEDFIIYGAPAVPSVIIAIGTLKGKLTKTKNFKLEIWRNPDMLRAGVANGTYKVMMSPSNVGVNLLNQGQNVAMLNILTNGITAFVSKNIAFKELEDFIGKKFIMPFKNDMPDIVFQAVCKKQGIDISKINITYTQTPPEAVNLFLTKDYDVAMLPEPMASAAIMKSKQMGLDVKRGFNMGNVWAQSFGGRAMIPQAGIIVDTEFYKQNLQSFEILHNDLVDGLKWLESNKQSAAEIGSNYLPAKPPIIANSFEYSNLTVVKASQIKEDLMKFFEIIFELNPKLIGNKLPSDNFFL